MIFVQVYRGMRKNRFLSKLCKAAGLNVRGSFDDLFEELTDKLQGSGRLIVIDEAEHLPIDAIDAVRRLNDFTGCGVVLCGLPVMLDMLRSYQREYAYIYNRTAISVQLTLLNEEDTRKLISTVMDGEVRCEVWHKASKGIGRDLRIICFEALRIAKLNNIAVKSDKFDRLINTVAKDLGRIV